MKRQLVVRTHAPGRTLTYVVLGVIGAAVVGVGLFELGRVAGGFRRIETAQERELLVAQVAAAEHRILELRQEIALHERSRQIDGQAFGEVRESLDTRERERSAKSPKRSTSPTTPRVTHAEPWAPMSRGIVTAMNWA